MRSDHNSVEGYSLANSNAGESNKGLVTAVDEAALPEIQPLEAASGNRSRLYA